MEDEKVDEWWSPVDDQQLMVGVSVNSLGESYLGK